MPNEIIERLEAERATAFSELETLTNRIVAEGRGSLSEAETARHAELTTSIDALDSRLDEAKALEERRRVAGASASRSGVEVVSEPTTYSAESERRGVSFLRDLVNRGVDPSASDRLQRHSREGEVEARDVGTGAFAGLTVPQYLTDLVAPVRRQGRPLADIAASHPLPPDGMTVNISRITTGTAVAAQATENAAAQETDADDTLLTINVRTIAGMQDVSRQAIERGTGTDAIIIADLLGAYDAELDRQIIHADGTSGTHLGMLSTVGNVDVSYADASPTAAELYPKLADAVQQIQTAVYSGASHLVMHPRRWWWLAKEVGTTFPFVTPGSLGTVQAGSLGSNPTSYEFNGRNLMGLPVVLDGNISITQGAGAEDCILVVTASELHLWEDAGSPVLIRVEDAFAGNLQVRLVVYGYSAFTAGRYPASQANILGTGMTTPAF